MIIKSMSRHSGTKQLFQYLLQEEKTTTKEHKPLVIRQNIRSRKLETMAKEYELNELNRMYRNSRQVAVYHTVLSWDKTDETKITDKVLKDFIKQFNNVYYNCLVTAVVHRDRHPHIHFVIAGTRLNGLSSRVSKSDLSKIKLGLTKFQLEKYPELVSLPEHGKGQKGVLKNIKNERGDKTTLLQCLETQFAKSFSREEFLTALNGSNIEPYYRASRLQGVMYKDRKYRLYRIGFPEERLSLLDERKKDIHKKLNDIKAIRQGRNSEQKRTLSSVYKANPITHDTIKDTKKELQELKDIRHDAELSDMPLEREMDNRGTEIKEQGDTKQNDTQQDNDIDIENNQNDTYE